MHGINPKIIIDEAIAVSIKRFQNIRHLEDVNRDGIIAASIYISCRINK